jgi:hypothetical protein
MQAMPPMEHHEDGRAWAPEAPTVVIDDEDEGHGGRAKKRRQAEEEQPLAEEAPLEQPRNEDKGSVFIYSLGENSLPEFDGTNVEALIETRFPGITPVDAFVRCVDYKKDDVCRPGHCGENRANLESVTSQPKFKMELKKVLLRLKRVFKSKGPDHVATVLTMCQQGRHRSVSNARLIAEVLKLKGYEVNGPEHLSKRDWHPRMCFKCRMCQPETNTDLFEAAANLV